MSDTVSVELDGQTFTMRRFTTRDFITIRKGEMDDVALIEVICAAVVEGPDPLDLPLEQTFDLLSRWMEAQTASAVPPPTG